MKSPQTIKLIPSKSFFLLLPIIDLPNNLINKILNVSLNNVYDKEICLGKKIAEYKKRIYVLFDNYSEIKEEVELHKLFIKSEYLDDELVYSSFKIPEEYLLDIDYITTSDYTKCSKEYMDLVLKYLKNSSSYDTFRRTFYPNDSDRQEVRDRLMLPNNTKLPELGRYFNPLEETLCLSKFLNLKQK